SGCERCKQLDVPLSDKRPAVLKGNGTASLCRCLYSIKGPFCPRGSTCVPLADFPACPHRPPDRVQGCPDGWSLPSVGSALSDTDGPPEPGPAAPSGFPPA